MKWEVDIQRQPLAVAHHMLVGARIPNDILQYAMSQLSVLGKRLGYTCLITVLGKGSFPDPDTHADTDSTVVSLTISGVKE